MHEFEEGGGRFATISPAHGLRELSDEVVTERILAAAAAPGLDPARPWQLNFDLSFRARALARFPRRLGI
ncbi:hypothetical protein [Cellulomonas iranensis]|uniref:Uncharacterized protein n=1 Tax=Cellulomonas iranensis TaxID=76862 RepID=A0ABU0GIT4_9CELL|nr:hypothetical protein [Cellulomonas iranensis]MDQ0425247.1 hypothetical protein [Cellulomonas iranensis]